MKLSAVLWNENQLYFRDCLDLFNCVRWHTNPRIDTLHSLLSWFDIISNRPSKWEIPILIICQATRKKWKIIQFEYYNSGKTIFNDMRFDVRSYLIALCNCTRKIINSFKCCCRWLHFTNLQISILKLYNHHRHWSSSVKQANVLYIW